MKQLRTFRQSIWWQVGQALLLLSAPLLLLVQPFRFTSPLVNYIVGYPCAFLLPWIGNVILLTFGRIWLTVIAVLLWLPLGLYSLGLFIGLLVSTTGIIKDGCDLSFYPFQESKWADSAVRLYRTNEGATTDFGVVIRQERQIVPGIVLVRQLDSFYHCYSFHMTPTSNGIEVEDRNSKCPPIGRTPRTYRLKRFLYF